MSISASKSQMEFSDSSPINADSCLDSTRLDLRPLSDDYIAHIAAFLPLDDAQDLLIGHVSREQKNRYTKAKRIFSLFFRTCILNRQDSLKIIRTAAQSNSCPIDKNELLQLIILNRTIPSNKIQRLKNTGLFPELSPQAWFILRAQCSPLKNNLVLQIPAAKSFNTIPKWSYLPNILSLSLVCTAKQHISFKNMFQAFQIFPRIKHLKIEYAAFSTTSLDKLLSLCKEYNLESLELKNCTGLELLSEKILSMHTHYESSSLERSLSNLTLENEDEVEAISHSNRLIPPLYNLKQLSLPSCEIDSIWKAISTLPNLEELLVTGQDLSTIPDSLSIKAPRIQSLYLLECKNATKTTKDSFVKLGSWLKHLPLSHFGISGTLESPFTSNCYSILSELKNPLKLLYFDNIKSGKLPSVTLTTLEQLYLPSDFLSSDKENEWLKSLLEQNKQLSILKICGWTLCPDNSLLNCLNIPSLSIFNARWMTSSHFAKICSLKNISELEIGLTKNIVWDNIKNIQYQHIKTLRIHCTRLNTRDLQTICSSFPKVEILDLQGVLQLPKKGLRALKSLECLQELDLGKAAIPSRLLKDLQEIAKRRESFLRLLSFGSPYSSRKSHLDSVKDNSLYQLTNALKSIYIE